MTTQTQAGPYQYVQSIRLPVLTALLDALPAAKKLFDEGYVYEAFVMLNDVERIETGRQVPICKREFLSQVLEAMPGDYKYPSFEG